MAKKEAGLVSFMKEKLLRLEEEQSEGDKSTHYSGWTLLHYGCWGGHTQVVQSILLDSSNNKNLNDPGRPSENGRTPFQLACSNGHIEIVMLILDSHNVTNFLDLPDRSGCTPLWYASRWGHIDIVRVLIASGHLLNTKKKGLFVEDNQMYTPIQIAYKNGNHEIIKLLKSYEENPTIFSKEMGKSSFILSSFPLN